MTTDFATARANMIDCQIHTAGVVDEGVLNSFATLPRELFVPEKLQNIAYTDESINIGQGRYLMEPITHAKMVQAAKPNSDDIVLDIGSGSGYSSAILAPLVSTVISLEHNKRQMDKAQRLLERFDLCQVVLESGDLEKGAAAHAPYSLIFINGAVPMVPKEILDQLDNNGRLLTIIQETPQSVGHVTKFSKSQDGSISSKTLFDASIPVLDAFLRAEEFQF